MSTLQNFPNAGGWIVSAQYTQIAAVFASETEARQAADAVTQGSDVKSAQITLVNPMDNQFNQKLEGASAPIGRSMWHSHLVLGAVGLLIGLVIAYLLVQWGPALTQSNPMFTYIALISPGLFIGLFVAGLIGLRPDRTRIVDAVKQAVRNNHYAIVINLRKNQSASKVNEILSRSSDTVVEAIK